MAADAAQPAGRKAEQAKQKNETTNKKTNEITLEKFNILTTLRSHIVSPSPPRLMSGELTPPLGRCTSSSSSNDDNNNLVEAFGLLAVKPRCRWVIITRATKTFLWPTIWSVALVLESLSIGVTIETMTREIDIFSSISSIFLVNSFGGMLK